MGIFLPWSSSGDIKTAHIDEGQNSPNAAGAGMRRSGVAGAS
ncbi:hypothetical protein [Sessilibacter sp. MAH4]